MDLCRVHKFDATRPVNPWAIARAELGSDAIIVMPKLIGGTHVFRLRGRWKIAVDRRMQVERAAHAIGHELGHVLLERLGVPREEQEHLADLFGGALLAPEPAVRAFYRAQGLKLRELAKSAVGTPTWAALRVGEAVGVPCAVLSPERVRTRGDFNWPAPEAIRRTRWSSELGAPKKIGTGRAAFFPSVL